jgi:hypothetical protein
MTARPAPGEPVTMASLDREVDTLLRGLESPRARYFDTGATRDTDEGKLEMAWAAGLFDGEGCVSASHAEGRKRKDGTQRTYPRLYVGNTDVRLLIRFQQAVGVGKIHGPYGRFSRGKEVRPMYQWTASHAAGRLAAQVLLPFVSEAKGVPMRMHFGGN